MASGKSRGSRKSRARWRSSTGKARPRLSITGAGRPPSDISPAKLTPSKVADMASRRSSGRRARCRSSASASAKSVSRLRSCASSKKIAATPSSPGSVCRRRTSRPSVTTSTRVRSENCRSRRVESPMVPPGWSSPSRDAMRRAAARAATRRGSNTRMRPPAAQASSISASGTMVVLPAPGGAISTALEALLRAARSAGSASVTGNSGSMGGGDYPGIPVHVTPTVSAIKRRGVASARPRPRARRHRTRPRTRRKIRRVYPNATNWWRIAWLLHDIGVGRAIRAINAAIPGEAIRPPGHAAAGNEAAGALLARHAGQLPFTRFGALRRFLRRQRQGEQQKTSQEDFAHGLALPVKINALLTT